MPPTAVIATGDKIDGITSVVQGYYDCDNVFNFYRQVWGGEHIHIGLHSKLEGEHVKLEGVERIKKASSLSTEEILSRCFPSGTNGNGAPPSAECTMVDLGCGYGGTARVAAKKLGCKVVCINVSKRENETNVAMTKEAGLQDKVIVPGEKSFFETGLPDASCDVVASQDALLHSGPERHRSMAEAARVLKPGGRMVFSDIMQFKETDPKDLQDVYNRCHLEDMSTPEEYIKWGKVHGLEFVEFVDMAENLATHYGSVRDVLVSRRGNLEGVEDEFIDNMVRGIEAWISAAQRNLICWGYMTFTKPDDDSSDDNATDAISATAEGWYNSDNAFNFYFKVWGGEHIHVGLYSKLNAEEAKLPVLDRIKKASILNAEELLARCFPASANGTSGTNGNGAPHTSESTMVDMGSGYGGSARLAAKTLGCKVYCINVTSRENDVNRALSKAAGIEDLVIIPGEKSYFDTGLPDACCEVVTSQDALLHAGSERHRAVGEAARLLKPGGRMVFNDVMQTNHADPKDLQEVYERVRLQDLGTPKSYAKWAESYGLTFVEFSDRTPDMKTHYESVKEVLMSHRGTSDGMEDEFIDNMARGLDAWVSAAERDLICWGYVTFAKPEKTSSDDDATDAISATAEGWYNSDNAFNFYFKVWGGEHIHVGLYSKLNAEEAKLPVLDRIKKASILNAEELLARCFPASANGTNGTNGNGAPHTSESTMVDMGSGYGGSARLAAKTLGCKVYCINVTSRENDVNRALSKAAGIEDLVIIPGEKSYFDTGLPDACCEVVTSQDALLHAGSERHRAVGEAARLLKPGGRMVFNDVMQTNHADPKDLQEVYERVRLQDLGTPKSYAKWAESYGLTFVEFSDRTPDMKTHYESVKEVLMSHRGTSDGMEDEFIDNMARGLDAWVSAAERDLICWGYVTFAKPEKTSSDDDATDAISATAEGWYNSDNAFNFYFKVWGGEHIHVGLYSKLNAEEAKLPVLDRIKKASILNAEELLARCFPASANGTNGTNGNGAPHTSESTMVDMGSGYGGSARLAAKTLGCKVYCINVTSRENDVNRALSKAAGIEDLVIIPGEKSYFDTGLPDACCEVVTSQDALLHAGSERHRAVGEAARLLKPGGRMVFNDVMQTNHADPKDLQEVYERVRLQDLGTPKSYAKWAESYGLTFVEFSDRTPDMKTHYESVKEVLMSHRGTSDGMEDEFIDNMARGLDAWVSAAERDLICWGYVTFAKPEKTSSDDDATDAISATAEGWYNSDNAFNFYFKVWGGEHIHVGLYSKLNAEEAKLPVLDRIKKASILNAEELLARCFPASANGTNGTNGNGAPHTSESTMVDMGSGYGGSARLAAKTLGCKVYCINVTSRENDVNRALSKAAGIEDLVIIPGEKSYFDTGLPDACCEVVTSQDALLHAGSERHRAVGEAARLLKPGGRMVFNDVMQTNHADPKDLQEVYERVRLQDLGTPKSYAKWAESYGLTFVEFSDRTPDMKTHYESVKEVLMSHRGTSDGMEDEFIDNMARGLDAWVSAAERDLICWGYVTFAKPEKTSSDDDATDAISATAEGWYNSDNAFNFYFKVWGGEHIHVGLYSKLNAEEAKLPVLDRIKKASILNAEELLARCFPASANGTNGTNGNGAPHTSESTMVDMGSGYGGSARLAAKTLGCKVYCINVTSRENDVNRALSKAAGIEDLVIIPGEKSYFDTGLPDACCEVVTSQDALLHAGSERHRAVGEAARLLKPGGRMVFNDVMQTNHADPKDLQEVYERVRLQDLGTPKSYAKWAESYGLTFVEFSDRTPDMKTHYESVKEVLMSHRGTSDGMEDEFIDNMARGLDAWVSAAERGLICWGYVTFAKPDDDSSDDNATDAISATAEGWYNSDNAFNFYFKVWGGEHIHVGLYSKLNAEEAKLPVLDRIKKASILNAEELLARCFPASANGTNGTNGDGAPHTSESTMVDMGSGYGGSARLAAKTLGCKVYCINVTSRENDVNRALSKAAGIEDLVIIPGEKSYFDTGLPDACCEVVTSQDALLHAGSERHRAVGEAARLLKPGGRMVFNDVMQTNHADPKDLQEVYERVRLQDLGTPKSYAKWAESYGLTFVEFSDRTPDMKTHYESVKEVLMSHRGTSDGMEDEFIDNMARGLDAWVSAAERDLICWGYVTFAKPNEQAAEH